MKVELENIRKYYGIKNSEQNRIVLDDITTVFESGTAVGIVGPSGSGKSTLLNIIGTLDSPSGGSVRLHSRDVSEMQEKDLAKIRNREIGFVFQRHHLLPQLTLLENVLLPTLPLTDKHAKNAASERAGDLLRKVGLTERIHQRPGELSVGECQRAAVVRALINEPKLLLADEPTGSLDRHSAEKLGDLLAEINRDTNITLIVVTHSENLAGKMQAMYNLTDGKLKSMNGS